MIIKVFKCANGEYIKQYDVSDDVTTVSIDVTFCRSPFNAFQFSDVYTADMDILVDRLSGKFVQLKLAEL